MKQLNPTLHEDVPADNKLHSYLWGDGLPKLISLLTRTATSGSTPHRMRSSISQETREALADIFGSEIGAVEVLSVKDIIPPLVDALRDAPHMYARAGAAHALRVIAEAQPTERKAMAKAGVLGLLLRFLNELEDADCPLKDGVPAMDLARDLLRWEGVAMRELRQAIRKDEASMTLSALLVLQVHPSSS